MVHIGQKIKEVVEQQKMPKNELSRLLNMSTTNIHKVFKRETIDTGLLQRISAILNHDFFEYYTAAATSMIIKEGKPVYITKPMEMAVIIEGLEKQLVLLHQENTYLKEINDLLRDKIKNMP